MEKKDLFNCKIYTNGNGVEMLKTLTTVGKCTIESRMTEKSFIHSPFMFIDNSMIWCGADMDFFKKSKLKEITYDEYNQIVFYPTKLSRISIEDANKAEVFARLVNTCKDWNQIDEYVPDWGNDHDNGNTKYAFWSDKNEIIVSTLCNTHTPFYFGTQEAAELFLKTFKKDLEYVKDLF